MRKKLPVIIGVTALAGGQQIAAHIVFLCIGQWFPQMLRRKPQCKTDCGELHQPLILLAHIAPVFRMGRIGAVGYAPGEKRPMVETIATQRKRSDAPERSGKAFQIGRGTVEVRGRSAERHPCATLREIGKKRRKAIIQRPPDIGAAFERIAVQRIKSRHMGSAHGVMHRASPFPSFSPCRLSVLPPAARQVAPDGHWLKARSGAAAAGQPLRAQFRGDRLGSC